MKTRGQHRNLSLSLSKKCFPKKMWMTSSSHFRQKKSKFEKSRFNYLSWSSNGWTSKNSNNAILILLTLKSWAIIWTLEEPWPITRNSSFLCCSLKSLKMLTSRLVKMNPIRIWRLKVTNFSYCEMRMPCCRIWDSQRMMTILRECSILISRNTLRPKPWLI